jgi:hypothetical protein
MSIRVMNRSSAKILILINYLIACIFQSWGNLILAIIVLWFVLIHKWERK